MFVNINICMFNVWLATFRHIGGIYIKILVKVSLSAYISPITHQKNPYLDCNVCEALICKSVYLFTVFGEHGRYIGNINHLWSSG